MNIFRSFLVLLIISFVIACSSKTENSAQQEEILSEDTLKTDISELTYFQLYQLVLEQSDGRGMDFHGDGYGQEAVPELSVISENTCGENECGKLMSLTNQSEREIVVVVKATFNLPGNPNNEMIREYEVSANGQTVIGCSHLCYDGKSYEFSREIISAGFKPAE